MYAMCKNYFDEPHDILTAINNGMMKVFKNIDQFDGTKGLFQNWVYTAVKNAALTLIRDKKTNQPLKDFKEINENIEQEYSEIRGNEKFITQPVEMLKHLPPTTRAICVLFYLEEYSIKEIVAALDTKEGTVKWHLNEGRNKLKDLFNNNKNVESAR